MQKIDASISVRELLDRFPGAMAVFIQRRMVCIGCPTNAFHSLADAAFIYGCSLEDLLESIHRAVEDEHGAKPQLTAAPTP